MDALRERGPGPVAWAHKMLIASALVCALVYAGFEMREFVRTGAGGAAVIAGLALIVAAGLAVYLRSLRGLRAKLTPAGDARRDA